MEKIKVKDQQAKAVMLRQELYKWCKCSLKTEF